MMNATATDPPGARRAMVLAAIAVGCALSLPAAAMLEGSAPVTALATWGTIAVVVACVAGGTAVAFRFRQAQGLTTGVGVAAIAVAVVVSGGDAFRAVLGIVGGLAFGSAVVGLAVRDWRRPIGGPLVFGSAALGLEAVAASSGRPDWTVPLALLIPLFAVTGLASRAITVWSAGDAAQVSARERRTWLRRAWRRTLWIVAAVGAAALLGIPGGISERVGAGMLPIVRALASLLAFVASQLVRPLFALAERFEVDTERARELLEQIGQRADRPPPPALPSGGGGATTRLLGLFVLVLVAYGVVRLTRRIRLPDRAAGPPEAGAPGALEGRDLPLPATAPPPSRRARLPADRVRRWYAEVLAVLARAGLPKNPALTPGEFLPEAAAAFPACADDLTALTRAYEDVRYGGTSLDPAALRRLRTRRRAILDAVRRPSGGHPLGR